MIRTERHGMTVIRRTIWSQFDLPFLLVTLALIVIGCVMIYSSYEASLSAGNSSLWENTVFRQAVFALLGMAFYLAAAAVDYHALIAWDRWLYAFVVVVLGVMLVIGQVSFGAQSWLTLSGSAQPSELCKVLMIVVLARALGADPDRLEQIGPFLLSALLVFPPAILVYLQPDFGAALVLVATWVGMCFLAGVRWRHIILLAGAGLLGLPLLWFRMADYMRKRILTFFFPEADPSGASYNITQALISIGSGGWWGKGLLRGTQSQLHFLRVRHTDFIFSVLAEELGFVGAMLFIGLFAFLILRLLRIAAQARDPYGRLIAGGVATMITVQTVVNLGMNANLLPVTGLTLPLVSYGGSSLMTTLMALGMAQSVTMRHAVPELSLK